MLYALCSIKNNIISEYPFFAALYNGEPRTKVGKNGKDLAVHKILKFAPKSISSRHTAFLNLMRYRFLAEVLM